MSVAGVRLVHRETPQTLRRVRALWQLNGDTAVPIGDITEQHYWAACDELYLPGGPSAYMNDPDRDTQLRRAIALLLQGTPAEWVAEWSGLPVRVTVPPTRVTWGVDLGCYELHGELITVTRSGPRAYDDGSGRWQRCYLAAELLPHLRHLDRDEVAQLGLLTGTCLSCCRSLTDPQSQQLGMGPVCYRRYPRLGEDSWTLTQIERAA